MCQSRLVLTATFLLLLPNLASFITHLSFFLFLVLYFSGTTVPTKAKGKKYKGGTASVSMTKWTNQAGNKRQVIATTVQDLNLMSDQEMAAPNSGWHGPEAGAVDEDDVWPVQPSAGDWKPAERGPPLVAHPHLTPSELLMADQSTSLSTFLCYYL